MRGELKKIIKFATELCYNTDLRPPQNEYEFNTRKLMFIDIVINQLKRNGLITEEERKKLELHTEDLFYYIMLNDERIKKNKKLEKLARLCCFNRRLRLRGLSEYFEVIKC